MIYQKCVIFISQIWIFGEIRESHNVSKIGLIFSALSKSACGELVRQVRHFVQPCSERCYVSLPATVIIVGSVVSIMVVLGAIIGIVVWRYKRYRDRYGNHQLLMTSDDEEPLDIAA